MVSNLVQELRLFFTQLIQERPSYFPPQTKLIAGVSGGPDSLALLHILKAIYQPDELLVAHIDHQLRPSSAAEAQFVRDTAVSWHIPCHTKEVDVAQLAVTQNLSLEEAGRLARYGYFAQLAMETGARVVVVAHHADDQVETVLMNILRGTGLAGLRGMQSVALLPGSEDVLLIRPFLHTTRAEIEAYCEAHNLQPVQDESNKDTSFLRNRLRHDLLPLLTKYNPQIKSHLQQLATTVTADYDLIEEAVATSWTAVLYRQTPEMLQLRRAEWLDLPLSLRRHILRRAVQALRPLTQEISFQTIERAREVIEKGHTGAQSSLPGDLSLIVGYEYLTLTVRQSIAGQHPQLAHTDLPQLPDDQPLLLPVPGAVSLAHDWQLTALPVMEITWPQIQNNDDPWTVYVTVGTATELMVRGRQRGERLRPLGMNGRTVTVKALMINRKIPAHLRARWPLVVHGEQIIWVVGHHLDERAQVSSETMPIVKLQCRHHSER